MSATVTPVYLPPPGSPPAAPPASSGLAGAVQDYAEMISKRSPLETAAYAAVTGACIYHGYRRNGSVVWGLVWGALGALFPLPTGVVALAQGFGQPAKRANPRRRRR